MATKYKKEEGWIKATLTLNDPQTFEGVKDVEMFTRGLVGPNPEIGEWKLTGKKLTIYCRRTGAKQS